MRIVLDTNILVRANPRSSPSGLASSLLLAAVSRPHSLILSSAILDEVRRVLAYPRVQARWPLNDQLINEYLARLEAAGIFVELQMRRTPSLIRDPDDDPIVQTAIQGRADVLCTRDRAFYDSLVQRVCALHGVRIVDDITLTQELRDLCA